MRLKFRFVKHTQVRFFPSLAKLEASLAREKSFLFRDASPLIKIKIPAARPCLVFPSGEAGKRWGEVERALSWLADLKVERSQRVFVMGGGAVLDSGSLAASLYRRGTGLVLVPTTLLAMVDATLGGKTAVDRDEGGLLEKNFAGTFFPADEVWVCPELLGSLPMRERVSGAGEMWKTLWLAGKTKGDGPLREFVSGAKVSRGLAGLIKICLKEKLRFVQRDPLDTKRIREALNYGHTVGHALESLAGGRLSHGEAVLWGMGVESAALGKGGRQMSMRILELADSLGLRFPLEFSREAEVWLPLFRADKKSRQGKIELTALSAPGRLVKKTLSLAELTEAIRVFQECARP